VTIAVHAGHIVKPGTLRGVLDQAGLTVDELIALLQTRATEVVMRRYTVVLVPEPEVGGYSVTVPALPGLFTQGDSREEALDAAREAIVFHLESLAEEGQPIPDDDGIVLEHVEVAVA
jgi:predicted RNase H-like HicB family nuclease